MSENERESQRDSQREKLLYGIERPSDLRKLPREAVEQVAQEIREEILARVSQTGGHLASSLGAVELITAIHYVFDTPQDRFVLDVGHQGYPHKMLTGRREDFASIGKRGGMSKFLRRTESEYDHFGAGHAGTSISAALGMARAKYHLGEPGVVIAFERNARTNKRLRGSGIEVIEVPGSELDRIGTGTRGLCCPIAREAVM